MSLWDSITNSVDSLWDAGADFVGDLTGYSDYVMDSTGLSPSEIELYGLEDTYDVGVGSFLTSSASSAWDTVSGAATNVWDSATDWFDVDVGKFASSAATALYGKDGKPDIGTVKGAKMSGSARSSGVTGSYKATAADLGYTAKVQNAMQAAMNSQMGGSPVTNTIGMLRSRQARGPLLQIPEATISLKSKRMRD